MKKLFKNSKIIFAFLIISFYSCSSDSEVSENESHFRRVSVIEKISSELNADIKVDPNVKEENSIIIKSEEEYREFILNVRKQIRDNENLVLEPVDIIGYVPNGCADGVYTGSGVSSGFATLKFDVSVSNGCISGISGYFSGWTLGVSYSQGGTSFGCNSGTVCGTINYNLFFEGVGTVYS